MTGDDNFCQRCAGALELRPVDGKERPVCTRCQRVVYHDPKVSASVVVECRGRVLMVRRGTEPGIGLWSLPGGYVDRGEVVEQAAQREVVEETGLHVRVTRLVGISSEEGHPVVLVTYDSEVLGGTAEPGPEVMELEFFSLDGLPPLAFPRDRQILDDWKVLRDGRAGAEESV